MNSKFMNMGKKAVVKAVLPLVFTAIIGSSIFTGCRSGYAKPPVKKQDIAQTSPPSTAMSSNTFTSSTFTPAKPKIDTVYNDPVPKEVSEAPTDVPKPINVAKKTTPVAPKAVKKAYSAPTVHALSMHGVSVDNGAVMGNYVIKLDKGHKNNTDAARNGGGWYLTEAALRFLLGDSAKVPNLMVSKWDAILMSDNVGDRGNVLSNYNLWYPSQLKTPGEWVISAKRVDEIKKDYEFVKQGKPIEVNLAPPAKRKSIAQSTGAENGNMAINDLNARLDSLGAEHSKTRTTVDSLVNSGKQTPNVPKAVIPASPSGDYIPGDTLTMYASKTDTIHGKMGVKEKARLAKEKAKEKARLAKEKAKEKINGTPDKIITTPTDSVGRTVIPLKQVFPKPTSSIEPSEQAKRSIAAVNAFMNRMKENAALKGKGGFA